jgi:ubiquinol-cytochrome c reductase cytochrome c subunit
VVLIAVALMATGALYAVLAPKPAMAASADADTIAQGKKLFLGNCATCHGLNAQGLQRDNGDLIGPTLIGVGAASVDFQVGTGRMPLAGPGVQGPQGPVRFSTTEINQMAAYIASLAPGPGVPAAEFSNGEGGDVAKGGAIFRVNCAMCHNFAGAGGALTEGKYAPAIEDISGQHIYEAMTTGPQAMPVFNDANLTPENKNDVIAYLNSIEEESAAGGHPLGNLGPVTEGLFAWIVGIGALIGLSVWLGAKAA